MIKKYIVVLCLIIMMAPFVFAQDNDTWFEGKEIKDLTFIGLDLVSVTELRPIVRPFVGQTFTNELFWEIQNLLWELEYFEDIVGNAKPGDEEKNSVIIEFKVMERPSVAAINIVGNSKVSTSDILDVVEIKTQDFVNEAQIKVDEVTIADLYLEKGFRKVVVKSRTERNVEENTISVFYEIMEGFKTTIKSIEFSGNAFASDSTLQGKVKQKSQSIFDSGIFQENLLEEDKALIAVYYKENGYIDAVVEKVDRIIEDEEDKERSFITLVFYINEGVQYTYGDVTFEGNNIFTDEELGKVVRQKNGSIVNKVKLDQDLIKIDQKYTDSGYIFNTIQKEEIRDGEQNILSYKVTIIERDKAHIGSIILQGNEKTKDSVIYRELPFEVGDIFSTDKLRQGYFNLYNLQYFSNISYNPVPSDVEGLMDLVISLEEQSWADIKFAIVFSGGEFPISGQIGWSDKNFLGNGQTFGVDLEFSNLKQKLALNFMDNYLFGKGWGGGAQFSVTHTYFQARLQDIIAPIFTDSDIPDPYTSVDEYLNSGTVDSSNYMSYDSVTFDFTVRTGVFNRTPVGKLGYNTSISTAADYIFYDDTIYRPYQKSIRDNLDRWILVNTWGNTFYLDSRDIYYNPEGGFLSEVYVGFTGLFFGDRHFIKTKFKQEAFFKLLDIPVLDNWNYELILALHGGLGIMWPLFDKYSPSAMDELYIDGMTIARGWGPNLDSIDKLNLKSLMDVSLELRSPVVKEYIWAVGFLDAAAGYNDRYGFLSTALEDWHFSVGGGVKLTIPGLPLRLYMSQPFSFDENQNLVTTDPEFVLSITAPGGF